MSDVYTLSDLEALALDCLRQAGASARVARPVARDVALGEAADLGDGGFAGLLRDIRLIRYGRLDPAARPVIADRRPGVLRVDAGHGFAASALAEAMAPLRARAEAQGLAMVHLTRASPPGPMAAALTDLAEAGLAALALQPGARAFGIAPGDPTVSPIDPIAAPALIQRLLAPAEALDDSPMGGPCAAQGTLLAVAEGAMAARDLFGPRPPAPCPRPPLGADHPVRLAPDLLAQVVNA